jgi:DNA modification methylase
MEVDVIKQMAAMQIVLRRVDDLLPYARNARTHSPAQVTKIAASIKEFGFTNPVLVDGSSGIIAGHGRVMGARKLGLAEVPTIDLGHLSPTQRKAYILADNQLALLAGWDDEMLAMELSELLEDGFDLGLTGFGENELGKLLAGVQPDGEGLTDKDDCPEPPVHPVSRPGDTWNLGPHRVRCGDSTSITDWDALMRGEPADCVWTDPPYNVAYESKLAGKIKNDDMSDTKFRDFLRAAYGCLITNMKPGSAIYVAHADTEGLNFRAAFIEAGFKLSGCLIWRKQSLVLGRSDFQWMHEPILYGWKPGAAHRFYGGRKQTTVVDHGEGGPIRQRPDGTWVVQVGDTILVVDGEAKLSESPSSIILHDKPSRSADHPTMKPVGLVERFLKFSARPGDLVIDAFGGSGTTLIAAERCGMRSRLMELDPKFVDVIVKRWQEHVGGEATLEADGRTFNEVSLDRPMSIAPVAELALEPAL